MCCQVLACCDVSFPEVRQNWCVDRLRWQLMSGCGVGTVGNEVWCCGLCSKGGILHPYGEEITRHIRLFEKLRIKKTKLLTSRTFLLRCRHHNTIRISFPTVPTPHPLTSCQQNLSTHQFCLTLGKDTSQQART